MLTILGIIPARGASKSVPRKNIKLLAGLPLIAYSIQEARKATYVSRLVVSTEDEEIASVARRFGAEIPFMRPAELALDHTTDFPVFEHCLEWLRQSEGYVPDIVVQLRPTSPLRRAEHIDAAIALLLKSPEADCVRSVCPAGQHPLKMWVRDGPWLRPFVPETVYGVHEAYNQPRQNLPRAYVQNGSIEVIRTTVITEQRSMTGKKIMAFPMDEHDSVNIDSPLDWALAEILIKERVAIEG
jgi:N-acylneuraminate cytidylyltransferase